MMRRAFFVALPIAALFFVWILAAQPRSVPASLDDRLEQAQWNAYFSGAAYETSVQRGSPFTEQAALQARQEQAIAAAQSLIAQGARTRLTVDPTTGQVDYLPGMSPQERAAH